MKYSDKKKPALFFKPCNIVILNHKKGNPAGWVKYDNPTGWVKTTQRWVRPFLTQRWVVKITQIGLFSTQQFLECMRRWQSI